MSKKQTSGKRVGFQSLPAELGEAVYALSVDGFDGHQNAEVRRDLDQESRPHSAWLRVANSAALAPLRWMRSVRLWPANSSVCRAGAEGYPCWCHHLHEFRRSGATDCNYHELFQFPAIQS